MEIGQWKTTRGVNGVYNQLKTLGLESYVAELDTYGFTIVPPELAAPAGFADRLRDAIIDKTRQADSSSAEINTIDPSRRSVDGGLRRHHRRDDRATQRPFRQAGLARQMAGLS
jgi:hypothetical protein